MDVYALVTEKITAALEAGTVPWQKPWATHGGLPRNLASRRPYRGMNVLLLSLGQPYRSPWWVTFRQAAQLGGTVRRGEKASLVTFWKLSDSPADPDGGAGEGSRRRAPLLRYYHVFNVEQCDGLAVPEAPAPAPEPLAAGEAVYRRMPRPPALVDGGDRAFYAPGPDCVGMPPLAAFRSAEDYYATLFHELTHSTGHPARLDRGLTQAPAPFGSPDYSREELVAEFGAAFLCGHVGLFPRVAENSAAYIDGWLRALKGDRRLLPIAASQAQRAADFILGAAPAPEPEAEP